jgi:hypothetical protein
MSFRLQMRQLNARERTYRQLLLDAPDPFETGRSNVMAGQRKRDVAEKGLRRLGGAELR